MPEMRPKQVTPGGATILTSTGVLIDLENPSPEDINLTDISHGLAFTCRYGAQSKHFCSVAQHSIHVLEYVRHHAQDDLNVHRWALLHDAAEAYLSDVPTPLKKILPRYQELEHNMMRAILERFDIPLIEQPAIVHEADTVVLHWEWPSVMPHHSAVTVHPPVIPFIHRVWAPKPPLEARDSFRQYAQALGLYDV